MNQLELEAARQLLLAMADLAERYSVDVTVIRRLPNGPVTELSVSAPNEVKLPLDID